MSAVFQQLQYKQYTNRGFPQAAAASGAIASDANKN